MNTSNLDGLSSNPSVLIFLSVRIQYLLSPKGLKLSLKSLSGAQAALLEEEGLLESQTIEQTMERFPSGTRRLAAQLRTPVQVDALWHILTDYNNLSQHIPNLSSSNLLSREGNCVYLEQVGSQRLMGFSFSAKVLLELIEDKELGTLDFKLMKGAFRRFEGSWKMQELNDGDGTCLLYELTVQGCIGMPVTLIEQRLREDLKTNLLAVEKAASNL